MKNRMFKIIPVILITIMLTTVLVGCDDDEDDKTQTTPTPTPTTRQITDLTGIVQIPYTVERVANNWPANNAIMVMLGAGDKIVATTPVAQRLPWFQKISPSIKDIPAPFASVTEVNVETLITTDPDVVIYSKGGLDGSVVNSIKQAGIPLIQLFFDNYDDLKVTVRTTGEVLGAKEEAKANAYCAYLDSNLKRVTSITSAIPNEQRPKVYHTSSKGPLNTDGRNTIIDTWIRTAGGINVAANEIDGNQKDINMEQLLAWNPDVIIIGAETSAKTKQDIMSDSRWNQLEAVKEGRVYINPRGVFYWDRYSAEEALQILWAAKTLHPDKFTDVDIAKETKDFYAKFFEYNLTDDEVNKILNALPPE